MKVFELTGAASGSVMNVFILVLPPLASTGVDRVRPY